jgi:DNA repair protein RecO (recombination protein O)
LGNFSLELLRSRAALIMEDPKRLAGLQSVCALVGLLAEREPHPKFYEVSQKLLEAIMQGELNWLALMVKWELRLLDELGFGLDLESCALTGEREDLVYVSPNSGRAASSKAGEPYKERLLELPPFLQRNAKAPHNATADEIRAGLELTGFFLNHHVLAPRNLPLPPPRERMLSGGGHSKS